MATPASMPKCLRVLPKERAATQLNPRERGGARGGEGGTRKERGSASVLNARAGEHPLNSACPRRRLRFLRP